LVSGIAIILYALLVVWYAQGTPVIGLQCAFTTRIAEVDRRYFPDTLAQPHLPRPGDRIVALGPKEIRSWSDYIITLSNLWRLPVYDVDSETDFNHMLNQPGRFEGLLRRGDQLWVWIELDRDGQRLEGFAVAGRPPVEEFISSLLWFIMKVAFFMVVGVVAWQRPDYAPARRLFFLCVVTVGAFMGGYHWLRIASAPPLVLVMMICIVLLPAACLHFYITFPQPKTLFQRHPRLTLTGIYALPGTVLAFLLATYLTLVYVYRSEGSVETVIGIARVLGWEIAVSIVISALLFLACIGALIHSFVSSRPESPERNQVKWILTGALAATVPIAYVLYLAATDMERFALGGTAWPMFLVSMFFTTAYVISVSRYGLMEVGKVLNWGIASLAISLAAGIVYSGLIFLSTILIGSQLESQSPLQQAVWVSFTAWLLLLGLDLFRWRMRKATDRLLHREKYQLERTLERMGQAVEQLVDEPTLCRRLLSVLSELLDFSQGAIYVRQGEPPVFVLASHLKDRPSLQELPPGSPLVDALMQSPLVRVPAVLGPIAPAQRQLVSLGGEIALGLRHQGQVMAIFIVGRRNVGRYDIEELHLLTTFAQLASLALHSARGRQQIEALNRDLQAKVEKISEQQRRIVALQSQLLRESAGAAPASTPPPPSSTHGLTLSRPIIGSSLLTQELLATVRKVANSASAVLIRGESGTGKELLARALHENSPRASKPFVKVHCAALSAGLLESELFGHVKGAFTGAHRDKVGRFELADGGTLFLDEIGDISLEVQTKLLRVLQEMTFERVGSSEPVQVDVRIIAATHQDLERLMREGRFREDLFYRLNVITIRMPPLRERREDIPELAQYFLSYYASRNGKEITVIDDDALAALKHYSWPGNIRELENVIERAVVLADGPALTLDELPEEIVQSPVPTSPSANGQAVELLPEASWSARQEQAERERLVRALAATRGNKAQAARALGIPRSTLISRLEKHGLLPRRGGSR
ncbi:MAG: sigma 54-interacting transcriptional regulator, partial [Gemmatales bacterium]|nr:sigma 54-interacting transcriptional regulator [Gemmatales bacterium]MDW8385988.1 sigma 54-interacting transcriptional regulator [Gemmatales bacterium]